MSSPEPPVAPALRQSASQRQRWWTIAGWIAVVVAIIVWTGVNVRFGVSWQNRWVRPAPSAQNWNGGDVTLSVARVWVETTIPARNEYSQPKTVTPGAVWVFVLVDYTLADPSVKAYCQLDLLGKGREWHTAASVSAPSISDVVPEARYGCLNTDWDNNPVASGSFGGVFEVPESALGEVWGLRVHTFRDLPSNLDVTEALKKHRATAVLPLTIPS